MKTTVDKRQVKNETYRLANLGYARGFAIQIAKGKSYYTIDYLGWVDAASARAYFYQFIEKKKGDNENGFN